MASPDADFAALMEDMRAYAAREAAYWESDGTQKYWEIPTKATWTFNPQNIEAMKVPFNRSALNTQLSAEYDGTGDNEVRVLMGTELQINYMAMMERAFRERHKLALRSFAHRTARANAHADNSYGVHTHTVLGLVQDLLSA